jgi:hypothetical protein
MENFDASMDETVMGATAKAPKKKQAKSNTPTTDINLAALAMRVAAKWADYPQLELIGLTQADFATDATAFNTLVQQRVVEMNTRPNTTKSVKELEADIAKGMKAIRGYLFEIYEDQKVATSHYTDFGLEKKGAAWKLPTDQQRLISALATIKTSIAAYNLGAKKFGTTFWTKLETDYTAAVAAGIANDGASSATVSNKEILKASIINNLTAIRYLIRANYMQTYNGVLRDFGFQKEKA